ncbi:MAG: hypothetical protein R3F56_05180 [Planctomycetota bacterium]
MTDRLDQRAPLEIRIADPRRARDEARARARARRQRWLNLALLGLVVPTVAAAWFRLGPLVSGPIRILIKMSAFLLPVLFLLVILVRIRRR